MTVDYQGYSPYADSFFGADVSVVDPDVDVLIKLEEERQKRRIILIPSESYVPLPVRQALGSVFTSIYAEGYPPSQMVGSDEELLADLAQQLSYYRRYADRRFYKGADYVHFVEALAQRRAAECFANERVSAEQIRVNVQPLSGAAANLAVYDALMEPGDTLMGMQLYQGGHLTHGSEFNVSGRRYKVVSYGVTKENGRLDWDQIRDLAETYHPKMIVAGYTSYPWAPDFLRFREIADRVGAYLMADIAHPAGMVIAGQYPNPVGIADVVTFTTHKTLCGPRGACILTTDQGLARKIDMAVFPGLQGGPHTNKFAAMCVAFQIARTEAFRDLQRRIVENAQALAKGLTDRELELAYGGTDTHLLLIDLKSAQSETNLSGSGPVYGEVAARILDLAGIVVNKNTIPGDTVTALATGVRLGTPWVSQRGMGVVEMDKLAHYIAQIIHGIVPFYYEGRRGRLPRGKIDVETLEAVRWAIDEMACIAATELECGCSMYPHYCLRPRERELAVPILQADTALADAKDAELVDMSDLGFVRVSGWRAQAFLDDACTADIAGLEPFQGQRSFVLDKYGTIVDDILVMRLPGDERRRDRYLVLANPENVDQLVSWLRGLSDGYTLFDEQDVWRKVRGPAKVEVLGEVDEDERMAAFAVRGPEAGAQMRQLFGADPRGAGLSWPRFSWQVARPSDGALMITQGGFSAADEHYLVLARLDDARAAWDALVQEGLTVGDALEVRERIRERGGLPTRWPEEGQSRSGSSYVEWVPEMFELAKSYFAGQNKLPQPETVVAKSAFAWAEPADPGLKRTPLYEEHQRLGAKMTGFAGWEMPLWYTSVGEEHQAVRETAGLFDVAHMGTIGVRGPHALEFLDLATVNYVHWLNDGESQYSALLDTEGHILDDIIVYRRSWDQFLVVVNAANLDKDWVWLNAVNEDETLIDHDRPWVGVLHPVQLLNLKDPSSCSEQKVDIALQGPNSLKILLACTEDPNLHFALNRLPRTKFISGALDGIDLLISRTGYTGEQMGFELYVHPDRAVDLWRMLLQKGEALGIQPCGLATRDSTRIEAGLPLYGHELAGPLDITQSEAGFSSYVKYHKPFFIGRSPYMAYNRETTRQVVRFQVTEHGARAIRGGEHGEPVVNRRGRMIGTVTSCALVGDRQIGMALVDERYTDPGTELLIYPPSRRAVCKPPEEMEPGDTVALPIDAEVIDRFPK